MLLIAKQINNQGVVCDIGTDHGLILIYLAKKHLIKKGYACDIAKKPLEQAKKNIVKYKVDNLITPVLADGLLGIKPIKINTCIISGLGNSTILNILQQDNENIELYILCPNDDANLIRQWIKDKKYYIENELIIKENNLIYEIIVVNKITGLKVKNKKDIYFGPILRHKYDKYFKDKWILKKMHYQTILKKIPNNSDKYQKIRKRIKFINKIIR